MKTIVIGRCREFGRKARPFQRNYIFHLEDGDMRYIGNVRTFVPDYMVSYLYIKKDHIGEHAK